MITLTKAEERIMQILWDIEKGFVIKDNQKEFPEPKPAYNSVYTIVRVLVKKEDYLLQSVWENFSILSFNIKRRI